MELSIHIPGKGCRRDIAIALMVFIAAFVVGTAHLRALRTDRSAVSSIELLYGPAVMLAYGYGFVSPDLHAYPELRAFLRGETESLPREVLPDTIIEMPSQVAAYHRYLVYAAALFWRLLGVSWSSLEPLLALLLAWSAIAVYGIMRLGMGKVLAFTGTLIFVVSPAMLGLLTELRDFSKAPFILTMLLIMGWLLKQRFGAGKLLLLAAFLGGIAGLGMGFRQDVFIFFPLSLVVLGAVSLHDRRRWLRLLAVPLCLVCFLVPSWPMLGRMEGAAHPDHHLVQGFSVKRLDNLGMVPASYRPLASGADCYVFSALYDQVQRMELGTAEHFTRNSPGSDAAGRQWMLQVGIRFPADLAARGYAAVLRVFRYADAYPPHFLEPTPIHVALYRAHRTVAAHYHQFGLFYGAAALLIFAGFHPVLAVAYFLLGLYVFGYIALQCEYRHAFHLSFMPIWVTGFLLTCGVRGARIVRRDGRPSLAQCARFASRATLAAACCILLVAVPLALLRLYQIRQVRPLLQACSMAERRPLSVMPHTRHGWTLFTIQDPARRSPESDLQALYGVVSALLNPELKLWHARGRYLVAEFDASAGVDWVIHKYASSIALNDFSQLLRLPAVTDTGVVIRYYFPVYELLMPHHEEEFRLERNRFVGLALPEEQAEAFLGLYEVSVPPEISLLMHFAQMDDAAPERLYQRIGFSPDPVLYYQSEKNATDNINLGEAARRFGRSEESSFFFRAQMLISRRPETRHFIASALVQLDDLDSALEAALDIGDTGVVPGTNQANLLERIGRQFQIKKMAEQAERALSAAWSLDSERESALRLELARLFGALSETDKALEHYRRALLPDPDRVEVVLDADSFMRGVLPHGERVVFWREIAEAAPQSLQPWLRLGIALEDVEEYAAADPVYLKAYTNHAHDPETLVRFATSGGGRLYFGDLDSVLSPVLERHPDLLPLAISRLDSAGFRALERGRAEASVMYYELAAAYAPDNAWFQLRLAQAYAADGGTAAARERFEVLLLGPYGIESAAELDRLLHDSGQDRLEYWRALSVKHPGNPHIQFYLAKAADGEVRSLFDAGAYGKVARLIEASCPEPCAAPDQVLLAHLSRLAETGDRDWAHAVAEVLKAHPALEDQALFWMLSMVAQLTPEALDRAQGVAQVMTDIFPESEPGWLALAGLHEKQGDLSASIDVCRKALGAATSVDHLAAFLDDLLVRLDAPGERVRIWQEAHEARPGDPVVATRLAQTLHHAGNLAFSEGFWSEAADWFGRALEVHPGDATLWLRKGEAFYRQGDSLEAVAAWKQAVLTGEDGTAGARAAQRIHAHLDPAARLSCWRALAEQAPGLPLVQAGLALALAQVGRIEEAERTAEALLVREPEYPEGLLALGVAVGLSGEIDDGLGHIAEAVRLRPELAETAAPVLGDYALNSGEPVQAEVLLRAAMTYDPENLLYVMHLGEALLKQNRPEEAVEQFLRILRAVPESPRTAVLLDEAYSLMGDADGLRRTWASILEAHPEAQVPREHWKRAGGDR